MKCLASELKSFSHLQELTLYFFLNTSSGITLLLNGLQNLLNIKFKLQFSRLNMSDVVGLGRGLQFLTIRVHFLQLSQGSIGVEGAPALAYGLPNLTNLFHLDLTSNSIGDNEAKYLSIGIKSLSLLGHLYLSYNNIGPNGATMLASAITCLKNLMVLLLHHNNVGLEGATALAKAIQHHKKFEILELSSNILVPKLVLRMHYSILKG